MRFWTNTARTRVASALVATGAAAFAVSSDALAPGCGEHPFQRMKRTVVRVDCAEDAAVELGSGFLLDARHVATNWHVVDCTSRAGTAHVAAGAERRTVMTVHRVPARDLAILRLEAAISGSAAHLAASDPSRVGQDVWAVGYPSAQDQLDAPTVTRGIVSAVGNDGSGTRLLQSDAATSPGSSGGPLFADDGSVIGINTRKALETVPVYRDGPSGPVLDIGQVPQAEGIGWAIAADELAPTLRELGIHAGAPPSRSRLAAPLAILASLLALHGWRRRTGAVRPVLRGLGSAVGHVMVDVPSGRELVLGRDPACEVVLPPGGVSASRRHCRIRFDPARRRFILVDCGSRNGTWVSRRGPRLDAGVEHLLRAGQRFRLGTTDYLFEVRLEPRSAR